MTSGQKIAFSLLSALVLFAVFVMSLHSKLFKELETRFYAQAKIEENTGQLDEISESCDSYISDILTLVEKGENAWTKNVSVRSYYVQNPSESDVNTRRRLTENLFAEIPALTGIRIVDKNGRNVHYSSFDDTDLLKQTGITKIYKNYPDIVKDASEIEFDQLVRITNESKSVLLFDQSRSRLILAVPFCWVDGIYSGSALFYLNLHEIEKELNSREVISIGQGLTLYSDDDYTGGFVLNIPYGTKNDFKAPFLSYWKSRSEAISRSGDSVQQPEKLLALPDGRYYVALSSNRIGKIRISAVYTSDIFELSAEIRLLIYISIFISILLVVFLIFSFFRDPVVTLQKRIKKIQLGLIENYLDGKEKREWADVARHLRQRRNDLSDEIIKSLHVHSKKRRKEISDYLEKNWDEIFAIFESKAGGEAQNVSASNVNAPAGTGAAELTGASIAEIRRMLEEVLQNRSIVAPVSAGAAVAAGASVVAASSASVRKAAKAPVVEEELDEVEELDEEVEELAEEAEPVEDAEELDEVEELDEEVEELAEEADPVEDAEELDEVEELDEEVEELEEEAEPVEDAEELDEVEELDEKVEELVEEAEPAEDAEELDEVDELDEEVEDLDEEVETLDEEVETLDEEVETLDEEVETLDEEVETLDDADEELDVLEEVVEEEPKPHNTMDSFEEFIKNLAVPVMTYKSSNETYFKTENFADVENIFAEELCLGCYDIIDFINADPVEMTIYPLPSYDEYIAASSATSEAAEEMTEPEQPVQETEEVEPVEEIAEPEPVEEISEPEAAEDDTDFADVTDFIEDPIDDEESEEEEVEDLSEEVPAYLNEPDFSMTMFGDNLTQDIPELESVLVIPKAPDNTIRESDDGVFSISEDLDCTDVVQDADFKSLVDSIL